MLSVSSEFSRAISENSTLLVKANVRFSVDSGKSDISLTGDDIVSLSVEQGTSSSSGFDIGSAIIGQLSITLNNHDGRFDEYDFTDGRIAVYVGKELTSDGNTTTEWVKRGTYIVDQPDSYSGVISITALDYLSKFEVAFPSETISFPCTAQALVTSLCSHVGVDLLREDIPNGSYTFNSPKLSSGDTCLSVLRYAMQVIGCYARMSDYKLLIEWYDTSVFEGEDWLDGGSFDASSPYSSGSSADGGNFTDYSSGDSIDGGNFLSSRKFHLLHAFSSLSVNTDDVVVTGIKVTAQNQVLADGDSGTPKSGETYIAGESGYVLAISSNPLIEYGQAASVAEMLAKSIIGMRFRPLSGKATCNPAIEAGDPALVIDRKGNMYRAYITSCTISVNSGMQLYCSAKSASRNSADNAGAATSAFVAARNEMERELSSRDSAIRNMSEQISASGGLYTTVRQDSAGASIYYLHNKPTLGESRIIYKVTADAVGISTDGGVTYATGLTATGDAILNRLSVTGIDASTVNISNLMAIGNGTNSLNLSSDEITFMMNGKANSLVISPSKMNRATDVVQNDSAPSEPYKTVPIGSTGTVVAASRPNVHPAVGYVYDKSTGDITYFYRVVCIVYYGGERHVVEESSEVTFTQDEFTPLNYWYKASKTLINEADFQLDLSFYYPKSTLYYSYETATVTLRPQSVSEARLYYLSLTFWTSTTSSAIYSDVTGEHYLSDANFNSYVNKGSVYTGTVEIPYTDGSENKRCVLNVASGLIASVGYFDAS